MIMVFKKDIFSCNKQLKSIFFLFSLSFFILNKSEAQTNLQSDTVILTLHDAETSFLKNNYDLLAAKYQINEADAAIIQARLWDNPNFSIDKEAYNKPSNKWFNIPQTGELALSFQQLIYLAGKRNKRINIEKFNSQITQYQFYDLMRSLHHELRTSFFEFFFLQKSLMVYDRELTALKKLVDAYANEYQKGNIPFKELARLQALQFNLENEKISVLQNVNEKQSDLVLLTGDSLSRPIKPILNVTAFDTIDVASYTLGHLLDLAWKNRYDLQISEIQIQLEQANLSLQKAMRIPDMTIGANYDRAGSYIPNYNSISLSIDLPLWNRNQGNIIMAENRIDERKTNRSLKELEVRNEIKKAYMQLIETDKLYKSSMQKFDANYDKLFDGIIIAYQNHTISLIEFIDYYEAYKNAKSEYYQLQNNRLDALEDLNMATGTTIIE
jgi:outer membrane protein, heavy metal efflux system